MRVPSRIVLLVALWLLAWGEISLANVLSGTALAAALLVAFPLVPRGRRAHLRFSAAGLARLLAHVLGQLVTSNVAMAAIIVRRRIDVRPGVLRHRLAVPSEEVVTLMTSVISLSPGTMTVDVDRASSTIYVHFLMLHDVERERRWLAHLEQLTVGAIAVGARPSRSDPSVPSAPSPGKEQP